MKQYCRGCKYHHNAGHPEHSNLAKKYNDWCTKQSSPAPKAIGWCKLNNIKRVEGY